MGKVIIGFDCFIQEIISNLIVHPLDVSNAYVVQYINPFNSVEITEIRLKCHQQFEEAFLVSLDTIFILSPEYKLLDFHS